MLRWDIESTICAIASGSVGAMRGIIRVTGPSSILVVQESTMPERKSQSTACWSSPKVASRISAKLPLGDLLGDIPCDLWIWPNERSYTGQPSVELHLLGSIPILEAGIERLCQCGARLAEPGEFTFRAFLANRLDLAQCEAVLGVIDAQSAQGLKVALQQLAGGLQLPLRQLRQDLIFLLADLEAGLDFVDEDIEFVSREALLERLHFAIDSIAPILKQIDDRGLSQSVPSVALFGIPNAGKSSLVNAIADTQIALVSDQPGTTRDYLRVLSKDERIQWIDTAGVEASDSDHPRSLAQTQTLRQWNEADLRWWCIDLSNRSVSPREQLQKAEQLEATRLGPIDRLWWIATKVDLATDEALSEWRELIAEDKSEHLERAEWIETSSKTKMGLTDIVDRIADWTWRRHSETTGILPATLIRCKASLAEAMQALNAAIEGASSHQGDELIASELRLALDHLGIVTGEIYTDEILDALFSRFCIGK